MATSKKSSPSKRKPAKTKAAVSKTPDAVVADDAVKKTDAVPPKAADAVPATGKDTVAATDTKKAEVAKDTKTVTAAVGASADAKVKEPIVEPKATTQKPAPVAEPVREKPKPTPAPAPVVTAAPEEKRSVFFPMVLGGVVAAGVGFFASQYGLFANKGEDPTIALRTDLSAQQERLVALESAEPAPIPTVDLSPIEGKLADLETRLKALEDRPVVVAPEGVDVDAVASAAAAAYAKELEGLRASVESQRGEIQDLLDNAKTVEQATSDAATLASAQTALAKIVSALDAGQPFPQALADLEALDVGEVDPALGSVAADGAATLSMLQTEFPEQARTALAVARANGEDEGQQGLGSFLKRSLGARSVAPREGDDPDAVLSRAEAAINSGDLTTTLTELDTLPEDAQAAIADWRASADAHLDARKAADALAQRLTAD